MAKPRKQKAEDTRSENSGAVVRHQKLCLSIDMSKRRIYGYTELKVVVPETGRIGLHADDMTIESVLIEGEPADFEFFPQYQLVEDERRWCLVSCTNSAADAACSAYMSSLDKEMAPNLFILCPKLVKSISDRQQEANGEETSPHSSGDSKHDHTEANGHAMHENVKLVRIDYSIEEAETGVYFKDNVLHSDNQMRRARCWFPCIDSSLQFCCYDLEFTVDSNLVAVSNGTLLHQVLSKDSPPRKTYVYRLSVPVNASCISLAVAPFEVLPDRHDSILSHICLPSSISKLWNTVGFFYSTFSHYEDYLSATFPFGSYKQVFIAPEVAITPMSLGASMCIFSSQLLFDEKVIDQTIDTRIKLAFALARQWFGVFITAEAPTDEWLLDGLAGFLTDSFIKRFLGNNEARYRRYKANCAVCRADVSHVTALSSPAATTHLYGTQCIGAYGKIRSWKAVAILQMLEKQMGPESFRKILQMIVYRAQDKTRSLRTLSTKERFSNNVEKCLVTEAAWLLLGTQLQLMFRHFANKIGNLERPFLKEFFPRWVGSCGCPVVRMGFSYNKRRNMVELAVFRGCTAAADSILPESNGNPDSESREGDSGWPGMMSIRVHELDGMYDHPVLSMAGETCQLLEIQCHSKLSAKRIQKPKKGSKPDGSDDNGDVAPAMDMRAGAESPLLWIRVDPEMEFLAEIQFHQPVQMWINQLEKDKDVIAQLQAISMLETLPHHSFSVVNALNNFLTDSKAFWRVRIEAAFALAHTASGETDYAGLLHLIKFYKSRRFDAVIGLPRPNDFHDFSEYFVLEAIPHAIATVRATDRKSPREAVEIISELLKYNDNNGNPYSDVYWLAALVQSIGALEFGEQSIQTLSSLLKRIDRLLQFDRLMPSYNGILTISCIHTLTQIAMKFSASLPLDQIFDLIKPYQNFKTTLWQVRIEASRALLDLEFYCKGINEALSLFVTFLEEEASFRGQVKLAVHVMHLCQLKDGSGTGDAIKNSTLVALLHLLESRKSFNNVILRHHLFCILQILAGRPPTLFGVPRIQLCPSKAENPTVTEEHPTTDAEHPSGIVEHPTIDVGPTIDVDACSEPSEAKEVKPALLKLKISKPQESPAETAYPPLLPDNISVPEPSKEVDTVSNSTERRVAIVRIRVKQHSAVSGRADDGGNVMENSRGAPNETEVGPSSSVSVDAPLRVTNDPATTSHYNHEAAHSPNDHGSRMTASIGSAKFLNDDELGKEFQCTADSRKGIQTKDHLSPSTKTTNREVEVQKYASIQSLSIGNRDDSGASLAKENRKEKKEKDKKEKEKKKEKKRKRDDPEYLERKRLKREKKQQKEIGKSKSGEENLLLADSQNLERTIESKMKVVPLIEGRKMEETVESKASGLRKSEQMVESRVLNGGGEQRTEAIEGGSVHKLRIKIKSRTIGNS